MNADHETAQELLAAYALHALSPEDEPRVEDLLASHVPSCLPCRSALEAFETTAGELALATGSARPPRMLGTRLRREMEGPSQRVWVPWVSAIAAVAVLTGVALWNVHLTGRVSDAELRQARTTEVLATVSHPSSRVVPMSLQRPVDGPSQVTAAFVPGRKTLFVFGSLPVPHAHGVYQLWLAVGDRFDSAGTFVPEGGVVLVRVQVDPRGYDGLLITEEIDHGASRPSGNRVAATTF